MKCRIHFYLMNEHFSVEHAEAHYNGEESEMNPKHEWEDELALTNEVDEVIEHENAIYPIQVTLKELEPMSNPVPGIYIAAQEFPKELIF